MGPYYRGTSHGVGAFFSALYEHPFLVFALAAIGVAVGVYCWRKKNRDTDQNS